MSMEVKICGITCLHDALSALDLGADYLGFILYSKSPRAISVGSLTSLLSGLGRRCRAVGVFVNERRENVEKIASECDLFAVQLHGDEHSSDFAGFPRPVWRAVRQRENRWLPEPGTWDAVRYVVDSSVPGMYGGSGMTASWADAASVAKKYPIMLSGGLTAENVREAVEIVRPVGVDVASGVESSPGKKDQKKLKAFIKSVKAMEQ